jgi:hypothetical protein
MDIQDIWPVTGPGITVVSSEDQVTPVTAYPLPEGTAFVSFDFQAMRDTGITFGFLGQNPERNDPDPVCDLGIDLYDKDGNGIGGPSAFLTSLPVTTDYVNNIVSGSGTGPLPTDSTYFHTVATYSSPNPDPPYPGFLNVTVSFLAGNPTEADPGFDLHEPVVAPPVSRSYGQIIG